MPKTPKRLKIKKTAAEEHGWENGIIPNCEKCGNKFAEDGHNYNERGGDQICDDCDELCDTCGLGKTLLGECPDAECLVLKIKKTEPTDTYGQSWKWIEEIDKKCPEGYICVWNKWEKGYKYIKIGKDDYMEEEEVITPPPAYKSEEKDLIAEWAKENRIERERYEVECKLDHFLEDEYGINEEELRELSYSIDCKPDDYDDGAYVCVYFKKKN